jgi:hypothetical protein
VLHDVLETTDTPPIELEYRLGARVAELVETLTEDESIGDRADEGSRAKLRHYRGSLSMLEWRLGRRHPLVEQLRLELELLDRHQPAPSSIARV